MSKFIVRFLAILGALWLIGMVIVLVAVIGWRGKFRPRRFSRPISSRRSWRTCRTRLRRS